jgi:hypothetical protein
MPDLTAKNRMRNKQAIPRIEPKDAARIFTKLERLMDGSGELVTALQRDGFAQFLNKLDDHVLQLAVQPDSWGERTRARLVSAIMCGLKGIQAESAAVKEIVDISNVVMPCFLLELGRRKGQIAAEFPRDPCEHEAHFGVSVSASAPMHPVTSEQITRLVTDFGEDLVGLCYFGAQRCREVIEAELNRAEVVPDSKARSCRTLASSSSLKPKH